MTNIKEDFKPAIKEIWQGGFFNHPEVQTEGLTSLLKILKKKYEEKLAELNKCENGGKHKWETHMTDGGSDTDCTKCFICQEYIKGQQKILRDLLSELV